MRWNDWLQIIALVVALGVFTPLLGRYIAAVFADDQTGDPEATSNGAAVARPAPFGERVFGPVERFIFRLCGVDPRREQRWNIYAISVVAFSAASVLFV